MVDYILHLQFVFMVGVRVRQVSKFLGEPEAVFDVFSGNKILRYFDTTVQVVNLVWGSGWYEDHIPEVLHDGPTLHPVLLMQPLA